MTAATPYPDAPDLSAEDYLAVGLATCFIREDGEVHEVKIVEPIPAAALEAILKGIPTSYQFISGASLGNILTGEMPQMPAGFPAEAQLCDDYVERAIAATRTFKRRPDTAALIPRETTFTDLNFSLERKRILNSERIVKTEDNVKQHAYTHKVL